MLAPRYTDREQAILDAKATIEHINSKLNTKYSTDDLSSNDKIQEISSSISKVTGKNPAQYEKTLKELSIGAGIAKTTKANAPQVKATAPRLTSIKANATQVSNNESRDISNLNTPLVPFPKDYNTSAQPASLTPPEKEVQAKAQANIDKEGNYIPSERKAEDKYIQRGFGTLGSTVGRGVATVATKVLLPNPELNKKANEIFDKIDSAISENATQSASQRAYGGDAYEALMAGDIKNTFLNASKGAVESMPTSLVLNNPVVATAWAIGNVDKIKRELVKEGYDEPTALASAIGKTSLEYVVDKFLGGASVINNLFKQGGKEAVRNLVKKSLIKEGSKAIGKNVMGESAEQVADNLIDIVVLGKDKGVFDGVGNTALTSFASGGVLTPIVVLHTSNVNKQIDKLNKATEQELKQKEAEFVDRSNKQREELFNRKSNDTENQQGLPSEGLNRQEESVSTNINQETGNGTIEAGRNVQGNEATQEQIAQQPTEAPITLNVDGEEVTITNNGDNTSTISVEGKEPIKISTDEANALVEEHTNTQQLNPNINEEQQDEAESNANDSNGENANGSNERQQEQVVGEESKGDEARQGNDEKSGSEEEVEQPTTETTTEGVDEATPSTLPNRIPLPKKGKNAITDEEIRQHNAEVDQKIADLDAEFKSASDELKDALITLSNAKKEHEKAKAKRTFLGSAQKQLNALKEAQAKVDSLQDTIKNHAKRRKALEDSKLKGVEGLKQKEIPLHELKIKELSQKLKEATKNIGVYFRAGFDSGKLKVGRQLGKKLEASKAKLETIKAKHKARLEGIKNKAQLLKEKKKAQGKLKSLKKEALISQNDKKILNDLLNNFNSKVLDQVSNLGNVIEYVKNEVEKIANGEKHNLDMAKIKEINDIIKELNKANREEAEASREDKIFIDKNLPINKNIVKTKLAQLFNITATDQATIDNELAKQGYDNDEINKIVLKHAGKQPADLEHEVEKIAESDIVIEGEAKTALEQRLEENAGLGQELLDIYEQVKGKVDGLDILDDMTAEEIESLPTRTIKRAIYELSKVDNTEGYTPLLMKPLVDELNTIKALRDANDNSIGQVQPLFTRGKGNNKLYGEVGKAIDYLRHKILFGVMGLGTNLGQFADMLSGYNKKNRALNNDIYKLDDIETQINKAEQLNEQDVDRIKKGVETLKGGVHNKGGQAVTQFVNMLLQYVPDNKGDYHREQQRKVVQLIKNAIKLNEANPNELDQDLIKALNGFNDKVLSKLDENFWDNPDAIDQFEAILKKEGYVAELNLAKDIIKIYKAKMEDSQKYRVDIGSEAPNIENYVPNLYVNKSNKAEPSSVKTVIKKMFDLRQANSSKARQKSVSAYSENGRYQLPITDLEYEHRSWLKDEHFAIHVAPLMVAGLNNMANPLIMAEMAKRNNLSTDNTDANKEAFIKAVNEDVKDVYERAYQRYNPSIMMEDVVKAINPLFGNTVAVNVYNVGSFIKQSGTAVGQTLLHSAMNLKLPDLSFKSPSYIELIDKYTSLNSSIVPKDANLRFGKWADKVSNTKLFKAIAPIANKASKADSYIDTTFRKIFSRPDIAGKNVLFNMYARLNAEKYGFKNDDKLYDNLLEAVKKGDKKALEFIKETANTANAPFGAPTGDVSKAGLAIRQIPTIGNIANAMIPLTSIRSSMVSNMLSEMAKLTSSYSTKADKISATRNISSIVSSQIMFQAIALTGIGQMANSWMEYYAIAFKELMNDIVGDDDEDEVRAKLLEAQKIMDTYNYQHMRSIGDALLASAPSGITETMIPTAPYMLIQDGLNNMTREALLSQYGSQQEKTMKNLYDELNAGELEKLKGDVAFKNKTIIGQANNKYKGDDKFSDFYKNFKIIRAINSSELIKKAIEDVNYSKQDLADAVTSFIMATTQSLDMISTFAGAKSQNEKYFKLKAKALKPQSTKEGEAKDEEYSKSIESKRSELNEAEKIKFDIKQGISRAILIQFGRLAKGDELTGRIYIDDRSIIDPMTDKPYSKYGVPFEQMGAYAPMLEKVLKNK